MIIGMWQPWDFSVVLFFQHNPTMSERDNIIRRQAELAARLFEPGNEHLAGGVEGREERRSEERAVRRAAVKAAKKGKKRALESESEAETEPSQRPRSSKRVKAEVAMGAAGEGSLEVSEEPCKR